MSVTHVSMKNALEWCPSTEIEIIVTLGLMIFLFLFGFGLTGVSLQSLFTYDKIRIHYVFKIIFSINVIVYWVTYVLSVYFYFSCYSINIGKTRSLSDASLSSVIIVMTVLCGIHFSQYIILQLNSISILYITFRKTKYKIKRISMITLLILVAISTSFFMLATYVFYIAYIGQPSAVLLMSPFIIAIVSTLLSNIMVLIMFIRRLFLMIRDQSMELSIRESQIQRISTKEVNSSIDAIATECLTVHNDLIYTEFSNTESFDNIERREHPSQMSQKKNAIIRTVSKLITITICGYIVACIQIGFVMAAAITVYSDLSKLILGYFCKILSVLTILYMHLHFSFSDDLYYGTLCCVKCDQGFQGILLKRALKSISRHSRKTSMILQQQHH